MRELSYFAGLSSKQMHDNHKCLLSRYSLCGGSVAWLVALLTIQVDLLIWTLILGSNPRCAREMLHLSPP